MSLIIGLRIVTWSAVDVIKNIRKRLQKINIKFKIVYLFTIISLIRYIKRLFYTLWCFCNPRICFIDKITFMNLRIFRIFVFVCRWLYFV